MRRGAVRIRILGKHDERAGEVGLRQDGGDAETGTGIELGGGVRYSAPASGLTVDAKVRGLIAHKDADYREWGASGAVRIDPGASGRGLSLSVTPAWGAASGGRSGCGRRAMRGGLRPRASSSREAASTRRPATGSAPSAGAA